MKPQHKKPSEVRSALVEHKRTFVVVGLFSAFINLLYLSPSLYMLQVYDRVISSSNLFTLGMLSLLLFGVYLIMGILEWARSRTLTRLGNQLDQKLSYRIFEAAFQRNLKGKHHAAGTAMNDLNVVRQFITGPGLNAIFDAPWIPIYIAVIWVFHPLLGMVSLAGVLVLTLLAFMTELTPRHPCAMPIKRLNAATNLRPAPCAMQKPFKPWACWIPSGNAGATSSWNFCPARQVRRITLETSRPPPSW